MCHNLQSVGIVWAILFPTLYSLFIQPSNIYYFSKVFVSLIDKNDNLFY